MRTTILIFITSVFPLIVSAQYTITGKVNDLKSGEPLPGAIVFFPEIEKGAYTDKNGDFTIGNLPAIKALVQVSCIGYRSIVNKIDISAGGNLKFSMEEAITEINEIVVTGTSKATEISKDPVPVILIENKELRAGAYTNIIDALVKIPGVSALTTGPNISKPFIHGLGFNRILTLFDGVRQEGQQWGDEHGIEVDENAVDHIEIIKGPSSLVYGSDAIAGVVNLLPAPHVVNDTITGKFESSFGTNNLQASASASLAGNKNGFVWGVVSSHKNATNYRNRYDGRVYGTAFNENDLSGYIGLNKGWGVSDIHFSYFDDLQEIPDGSRDSLTRKFTKQITEADTFRPIVSQRELNTYKISDIHQHVRFFRIYTSNNIIIGKSRLNILAGFQQSNRQEFSHPEFPAMPGLSLNLRTINYDIKFSIPENAGFEATIGINGMLQANRSTGSEFIIPDYILFDAGPFVVVSKKIKKLNISGGLRIDNRILDEKVLYAGIDKEDGLLQRTWLPDTAGSARLFSGFSKQFHGLSGSFGFAYDFSPDIILKGNVGRGYRAPNIAEISANGVHPGTLIYQIGNKDLKPEFSLQEDIELSYRSDRVSGYIDLFNNYITDYIYNKRLVGYDGKDSVVVKGNQTFRFEQVNARLYGWEMSLDVHPLQWIHFENSISAVYAVNKGNTMTPVTPETKYLPLIPPLHSNSEIQLNFRNSKKQFRLSYLRLGMEVFSRQDRVFSENGTETPTPGYVLLNAGIGANLFERSGKEILSISIMGSNLTNTAYQSHLSRLKYFEEYPGNQTGRSGIYNIGRNINIRVSLPLNFRYN